MAQWAISNLRFLLDTETDADSPVTEELIGQIRENQESLEMRLFVHGNNGTATSDPPNDTTGVLTDTGASYTVDEHNGRTLLITSGTAKNKFYRIDDTTATTIVCSGDNLYSDGVRSGDTYRIFYDLQPIAAHTHNGVNSANVTPAAATLTQSMLKTSTGEVSLQVDYPDDDDSVNAALPGGEYGFYPQCKFVEDQSSTTGASTFLMQIANAGWSGFASYLTNIYIYVDRDASASIAYATAYAQQRYVTSSGEVHWLFILRDYDTSKIIAKWQAPDHPCFGNGGKPGIVGHPFFEVFEDAGNLYKWRRDPETGLFTDQKQRVEIITINPTRGELNRIEKKKIIDDDTAPDLSWFEAFDNLYEIDETRTADWPDVPITVALPHKNDENAIVGDWRFAPPNTHLKPVKKVIVKPPGLEIAAIKNKPGGPPA